MQNNQSCLESLFSVFMHKQKRKTTSFKITQKKKKLNLSLNTQSKRSICKKITLSKSLRQTNSPTTQVPNSVFDVQERQKLRINSLQNKKNKGLNFHPRKVSFNTTAASNKIVSTQFIPSNQFTTKNISQYLKIQTVKKQNQCQRPMFHKQSDLKLQRRERICSLNQQQTTKKPQNTAEYIARIQKIIEDSKKLTAQYGKTQIKRNQQHQQNNFILNLHSNIQRTDQGKKQIIKQINNIHFPNKNQQDTIQSKQQKIQEIWKVLPDYQKDPQKHQQTQQIYISDYKNKPHLGDGIMTIISKFDQSSKKSQRLQFSSVVFRMNGDNFRNTQFVDKSNIQNFQQRNSLGKTDNPYSCINKYQYLNQNHDPLQLRKYKQQDQIIEKQIGQQDINDNEQKDQQQKICFQQILDPFEKINYLGVGRFSSVYLYRVKKLNFLFAMKQILHFTIEINNMQEQIMQQIRIQNLCNHPNILQIYNVYKDKKKIYLALEYGEDTLLKKMESQIDKKYKEKDSLKYLKQICEGLKYLHQNNIIHRDIKPENIIIVDGVCKIGDFGWAIIKQQKVFQICGTPCYISPQIQNNLAYTQKTDCWSLGVLAYQLVNGKIDQDFFNGKQFRYQILKFDSEVSEDYKEMIRKLLEVDEQKRISIQDLLKMQFFRRIN